MRTPRISAILITYNEAERLRSTLDSVAWADEIVIVDSGSTDATERIAREFTDRFYLRDWPGFGPQKQRALELATGEWILSIDADEVVSEPLSRAIQAAVAAAGEDRSGFEVRRQMYYLGRMLNSRGWYREWRMRVFRKSKARFSPAPIHERVILDGRPARIGVGALIHHPYSSMQHHIAKMNAYTTLVAAQRHARGDRVRFPAVALGYGVGAFLRDYVMRGRFLDGGPGAVFSALSGTYAFLKFAKLWSPGEHEAEAASSSAYPLPLRSGSDEEHVAARAS